MNQRIDNSDNIVDASENIVDVSENIHKIKEKKREMLLQMIMRQTNYSKEEALKQLKIWNYNTLYVMKAYLDPKFYEKKKEENTKSVNQRMMTEFRLFCDKSMKLHNLRQDLIQQHAIIQSIAKEQQETQEQ